MVAEVYVRGAYAYDVEGASLASGLDMSDLPSLTQQQFAEDADINTIVRRFGLTGQMPETLAMPVSGDFSDAVDFQTAMGVIRRAEEEFMTVPPEIRARFGNDPGRLISFLDDESNRDEALKLGLLRPPVEKTRDAVAAIDELAASLAPKAPD